MVYVFRVADFEQRLLVLDEDIQAFKKKEVMNMDEMRNNVGNLRQISDRLEAALMELEVRMLIRYHSLLLRRLKLSQFKVQRDETSSEGPLLLFS